MIQPGDADVIELAGLLEHHARRAPDAVRTGLAWVPRRVTLPDWGAELVPPPLWDGQPGPSGLVRWSFAFGSRRAVSFPCAGGIPPLFRAYLGAAYGHRLPLWDGERAWVLPPVLPHCPLFHFSQLAGAWIHLYRTARFLPIAESVCGRWLACSDRRTARTGEDAGVFAFRVEDLFRLEPALFRAEVPEDLASPHGIQIYASFRDMLIDGCMGPPPPWADWPSPHARDAESPPPRFDWEPLLDASPLPEDEACPQDARLDAGNLDPHLERIGRKINYLGSRDPGCLVWGAEHHRYRMHPTLTIGERKAFEREEGCELPPAYAAFLSRVGNGGRGPWQWMRRVEYSGALWAWYWQATSKRDKGRLSKPFPHRSLWNPVREPENRKQEADYLNHKHMRGAVQIGEATDGSPARAMLLLVVSGPERGHVWVDLRGFGEGIRPLVRRGPLSFLSWYEEGLDAEIQRIEAVYEAHRRRVAGFLCEGTPQE